MDYLKQKEEVINYIKGGEKKNDNLRLGIEFEHFIIDKETLRTITYYDEKVGPDIMKVNLFLGQEKVKKQLH